MNTPYCSVRRFPWIFVTLIVLIGPSRSHPGVQVQTTAGINGVVHGLFPGIDVTINQAVGQPDPTSSSPINFTVIFSEGVFGFTATDVSLAGTTVAGTLAVSVTGSGSNYTVSISGMTGTGTVVASIPVNVVSGGGGSTTNRASTSTDNTVSFMAALQGDSNNDFVLSVADVFFDIRSLFAAGPPAPAHADCNGDGVLTVADVFFLINHLFFGGSAPL